MLVFFIYLGGNYLSLEPYQMEHHLQYHIYYKILYQALYLTQSVNMIFMHIFILNIYACIYLGNKKLKD